MKFIHSISCPLDIFQIFPRFLEINFGKVHFIKIDKRPRAMVFLNLASGEDNSISNNPALKKDPDKVYDP